VLTGQRASDGQAALAVTGSSRSALEFPSVEAQATLYVDNAAMQLVRAPKPIRCAAHRGNLFGDILSDESRHATGRHRTCCRQLARRQRAGSFLQPVHVQPRTSPASMRPTPLAMALSAAIVAAGRRLKARRKPPTSWKRAVDAVLAAGPSHRRSGRTRRGRRGLVSAWGSWVAGGPSNRGGPANPIPSSSFPFSSSLIFPFPLSLLLGTGNTEQAFPLAARAVAGIERSGLRSGTAHHRACRRPKGA